VNLTQQATNRVLMIRPLRFAGNAQTADSNRFQDLTVQDAEEVIQSQALDEFDALVNQLQVAGVEVHVFADTPAPHTPDSIFPNNWFSTHDDGTLVLYPMQAINRRLERRADVFEHLSKQGLRITRTVDFTDHESRGEFLEGTGSLVLDRVQRIAYACLSPRTHLNVLGEFAQQLDYDLVTFDAADADGVPIYHTNVLMCIGTRFAVVCVDAIAMAQRADVLASLVQSGHEVITITMTQMQAFAGNMLELQNESGGLCLAMSQSAFDALKPEQRQRLHQLSGELVVTAIPTIERLGGGSVRCMLAELFLPLR
jgi:hypothetical protein